MELTYVLTCIGWFSMFLVWKLLPQPLVFTDFTSECVRVSYIRLILYVTIHHNHRAFMVYCWNSSAKTSENDYQMHWRYVSEDDTTGIFWLLEILQGLKYGNSLTPLFIYKALCGSCVDKQLRCSAYLHLTKLSTKAIWHLVTAAVQTSGLTWRLFKNPTKNYCWFFSVFRFQNCTDLFQPC